MQLESRLSGQEADIYPAQDFFTSNAAAVEPSTLTRLRLLVSDYGSLLLTFLKLYLQARVLMAQNYILNCKLRMWSAAFVYFKIQIFFVRLAHGFPVGECWPRR